uniref:Uncharacterized protein n=2 Tax=Aegilops tauschii TaxID=37682 RepID=N1QXJ8_AEGTA|nr:uncharacterized protein LOC120968047 [Aegilops tauschii subsp. strangulata]XP_040250364.1 uncharacterized protein LOC120968047 [Aegilops tauschii subsp. strangulata]
MAAGTVELVRGAVEAISHLTEKRCRKCRRMVKKRELVKHLEDHLDEYEKLYATDKGALERKIERLEALEERLREEKAELLHKLETIDKDHKEEKRRLKKDKSQLKKELVQAKNEEARLRALALSEIRIKCKLCNETVLAKDRESHIEIHRTERRMLSKHLSGKHL